MKCWICGGEATTGEHIVKASDLKSMFGTVTQKSPLFLSTIEKRNVRINSIKKSGEIKSNALLCAYCNNARTAPFDKAWESMSKFLHSRDDQREGSIIRLEKVFPGKTKEGMLNIHLFFAKLFGCAIEDLEVPINIKEFREAILQKHSHPNLYISFGSSCGLATGNTDIEAANQHGRCKFATWFYVVGRIAAQIIYAEPNERRRGLQNTWHPDTVSKRIRLAKF